MNVTQIDLLHKSFYAIFVGLFLASKLLTIGYTNWLNALVIWSGFIILFFSRKLRLQNFTKKGKIIFFVYFTTAIIWLVRSLTIDTNNHFSGTPILTIFGSVGFGIFIYLLPCMFFFSVNEMLPTLKRSIKLLIVISVIGLLLSINTIMNNHTPVIFSICQVSIFILPFLYYIKRKIIYISSIFVLLLLFETINERAALIYFTLCIVGCICIWMKVPSIVWRVGMLAGVTVSIAILICSLYYGISIFEVLQTTYSDNLEIVKDTRSFIFYELRDDLSKNHLWLFGKGILGTCYSPYFEFVEEGDSRYRIGLEVGFLQYLLKGGLYYMLLFMITMILAMHNAFLKSNNVFVKTIGVLILVNFLVSCVSQGPIMDFRNFFLWIMIGMCFSKTMLSLTDNHVKLLINKRR